jgi:uncharacterized integral membrane protein (TIGR00698 family)
VAAAVGLGCAAVGHGLVPQVGVLTWAVALGVAAANLKLIPASRKAALGFLTKKLLRVGVALLGFSVSFAAIASLGASVIAIVVVSLVATLIFTFWLGTRWRLDKSRSLLLGTGIAICGASAIAAMEDAAGADDEDVTAAIAMITLCGTAALALLPLAHHAFGLSDLQFAVWAGASVHEVGQVVAAASPAGAAVVATAVVVKLTRVLLLAPVVATVSAMRRSERRRLTLIPLFVLGFLGCAVLRSVGVVPTVALTWVGHLQVATLGAALFGMGASVHLASLFRRGGTLVAVAVTGTLFLTGLTLAAIHLLLP